MAKIVTDNPAVGDADLPPIVTDNPRVAAMLAQVEASLGYPLSDSARATVVASGARAAARDTAPAAAASAYEARHGHLRRDCAQCGRAYTPPRNDGRYCSAACKQRAYRRRHA
jgi:hypothetical protein